MGSTATSPPVRWPVPTVSYGRQPWKALYFAWILATLPFLALAWTVQYFLRLHPHPPSWSLRESLTARAIQRRTMIVSQTAFFANIVHFGDGRGELAPEALNRSGRLRRSRAQWVPVPEDGGKWFRGHGVKEGCEPGRVAAMVWGKEGRGPPREDLAVGPNETVFLHLHGGGFTTGNATEAYFAHTLAKQVLACDAVNHAVSPEYRQLDQGPWPMPLVDCITTYAYLVDTLKVSPSRILVGGDSAGGCLALSLLRYLRDEVKVAEMPRAALLVSPAADFSYSLGPKLGLLPFPNRGVDILNLDAWSPFIAACLLRDNPVSLLDSPYLSPAGATVPVTPELFARFPPCLIVGGGGEWFGGDFPELARRMELGGVECEYVEGEDAPHDFILLDWWAEDKKKDAVRRMQAWVDKQFA